MNRDEHEAWIARQEMEVADKALEDSPRIPEGVVELLLSLGFVWDTAECECELLEQDGRCRDRCSCRAWNQLDGVRFAVRPGLYERRDMRPRRLVSPWQAP